MEPIKNKSKTNAGIQAIFFDLDNTLITTRKSDSKACSKLKDILIEEYSIPNEGAATICSSFLKSFRKCPENPDVNLDTWRKYLWKESLGVEYKKYVEPIYQAWLKLRYKYLEVPSDITSVLQALRQHYLIGLISNGPSHSQWEKINRLSLRPYFDIIRVSGDLPWEKPQPKIFQEATRFLSVDPTHCLMVGDKLETDILGGIQANLGGTVWLPLNGDDFLEDTDPQPDFVLKHITDIVNILPKIKNASGMTKRGSLRDRMYGFSKLSLADVDEGNSNSSDGS